MPVERIPREPVPIKKKPKSRRGDNLRGRRMAGAGRAPGTPNKITMDAKEAALLGACLHGSDGEGKDGLVGAMYRLFKDYPETYTREILGKMIPATVNAQVNSTTTVTQAPRSFSREELISQLRDRGINISSINLDKSQYKVLDYKNGSSRDGENSGSNGAGAGAETPTSMRSGKTFDKREPGE